MGSHAFSVCTVDLQEQETYEFIGPHGIVIASAMRTRFNPRTEIRVCANTAKCENPVEVLCQTGFFLLRCMYLSPNTECFCVSWRLLFVLAHPNPDVTSGRLIHEPIRGGKDVTTISQMALNVYWFR